MPLGMEVGLSPLGLVAVINSSWLYVTTMTFHRMPTDALTAGLSRSARNLPAAPLELMTGFSI